MSTARPLETKKTLVARVLVKEAKCRVLVMSLSGVMDMVRFHLTSSDIPPDFEQALRRLPHLHQNPWYTEQTEEMESSVKASLDI